MTPTKLRQLQRLLGWLPLMAVGLYALWEQSPIRMSRMAVMARMNARYDWLPAGLEAALLVLALLVFAGLGGLLELREPVAATPEARMRQHSLRVAGIVYVAFVLWHLTTVWIPARALGLGVLEGMALAEAQMDRVWGALGYALGLSAFAVLLGFGLSGEASDKARSLASFALALGVWVWGINVLSAYVAGAPLF